MDEILTFIILWVVLYLINLLSKKIKKQSTAKSPVAPGSSVTEFPGAQVSDSKEPEISPSFFPEEQLEESESDQEYYEEEEELIEQDVLSEVTKEPAEVRPSPTLPEKPLEEVKEITRRSVRSLKEYVIWKEILDKPLSLRPRLHHNRNRLVS